MRPWQLMLMATLLVVAKGIHDYISADSREARRKALSTVALGMSSSSVVIGYALLTEQVE